MNPKTWLPVALAALAIALAGCAEQKGDKGDTGPAGSPSASRSINQTTLTAAITSASVGAGNPTLTFTVTDQQGLSYADLTTGQVRFNIAKLNPSAGGNASYWQDYIVTVENNGGVGPALSTISTMQGTTENTGTLSYANGVYTYAFATNITAVTLPSKYKAGNTLLNPVEASYQPSLTHRVAMQISGTNPLTGVALPPVNATYDFVPAGGSVTSTRNIVKTETCNQCHNQLALHGGGRYDTKYCVTCHNPGTADANSGNTVDFKVMVHRIHFGSDLPSLVSNGIPYQIYGFQNTLVDFSAGTLPQMVIGKTLLAGSSVSTFPTCTKCHVESDTAVTDAANWRTAPTKEACSSCHDNVVFDGSTPPAWKMAHAGGTYTDNSSCAGCHGANGSAKVDAMHSYPADLKTIASNFQFNVEGVTYNSGTGVATVTISVKNPNDGTYYNILDTTKWPTTGTVSASLSALIGWPALEHINVGNGSSGTPSSAVTLNMLTGSPTKSGDCTTGPCSFTLSTTLSASAIATIASQGGIVAGIYGRPVGTIVNHATPTTVAAGGVLSRTNVPAVVKYFDTTDTKCPTGCKLLSSGNSRRVVVDATTKCDNCHGTVQAHGGSRADNTQLCVVCHNPANTDISNRVAGAPTGPVGTSNNLDGLKERSVDFKNFIHGIHAGTASVNGGMRTNPFVINSTADFSDVGFPGHLDNCTNCHVTGTFTLPLKAEVLAAVTNSDPALTTRYSGSSFPSGAVKTSEQDITDDGITTPTAHACSACHDSSTAMAHMRQNGAGFTSSTGIPAGTVLDPIWKRIDVTTFTSAGVPVQTGQLFETCPICHGAGTVMDVSVVHTLK